jgi:hypothetical protein
MHTMLTTVAVATLFVTLGQPPAAQPKRPGGDVHATITYTGSGKVDAAHRIWAFLFDTSTPGPGDKPIAVQPITKSGDAIILKAVTVNPVYVLVAYDESGQYDGKSPTPPIGTPIGMYSTNGKEPAAITPGAKVKVSFDDSRRMGK